MGFRISISEEDLQIAKLLRKHPEQIFSKPYGGYMLFLLSGNVKTLIPDFKKQAPLLDELTGEDIAFAVFSREYQFKIKLPFNKRTSNDKSNNQEITIHANNQGNEHFEDFVTRIAKSGELGTLFDGDKITAINSASDQVARELDVLDQVPCLILINALPERSVIFYKLDKLILTNLEQILRKTIQDLRKDQAYKQLTQSLNKLHEIDQEISKTRDEIKTLKDCIEQSKGRLDSRIQSAINIITNTLTALTYENHEQINFPAAKFTNDLTITIPPQLLQAPVERQLQTLNRAIHLIHSHGMQLFQCNTRKPHDKHLKQLRLPRFSGQAAA